MPKPKSDNPVGRPLKYKTVQELQSAIDEYFAYCDNRIKQVHSKEGESYAIANPEPYTMAGLAYALGMDRRTLLDYSNRDQFLPTIKNARNKVEADVERRMNDRETFTPGLIFNLKNNFGYTDSRDTNIRVKELPKPIMDFTDVQQDDSNS